MANVVVRDVHNPAGVTYSAGDLEHLYAEDIQELRAGLALGTKDITPLVVFSKDGVQLDSTSAQPAASAAVQGRLWLVKGTAGNPDKVQICLKKSNDTYGWFDLLEAD